MSGEKVLAWFVAWRCGCGQTSTAGDLPVRCHGHDTERISRAEAIPILTEYADTHLCGQTVQPCDQEAAA